MSSWERSLREQQPRRHPKNPSFSTILLDEIFRSIDGDDHKKCEERKHCKQQSLRKSSNNNGGVVRVKASSIKDEEVASLKRAYIMEKLMEKKITEKVSSSRRTSSLPDMESTRSLQDNDPMFFSTSSSSSDTSSGGLSLSDAEFYGSAKTRTSCFAAAKPKPSKKIAPPKPERRQNRSYYEQSEYYFFDDYNSQQTSKADENLIKSKSRAMKIYSNLKKVKQPISPGGRFTSFINSLFTNGNAKKVKNVNINGGYEDASVERRKPKSTNASTCSSASSFSRSCLNKSAPDQSKAKHDISGTKRTVRFYPLSVIVDEDSRPCGHKSLYDDEFDKYRSPHFAESLTGVKSRVMEKNRKIKDGARDVFRGYQDQKSDYFRKEKIVRDYEDEDEDDDAVSDSSSDLFEIDHLALFEGKRFYEELPVYETTHLDRNRPIASGMIC